MRTSCKARRSANVVTDAASRLRANLQGRMTIGLSRPLVMTDNARLMTRALFVFLHPTGTVRPGSHPYQSRLAGMSASRAWPKLPVEHSSDAEHRGRPYWCRNKGCAAEYTNRAESRHPPAVRTAGASPCMTARPRCRHLGPALPLQSAALTSPNGNLRVRGPGERNGRRRHRPSSLRRPRARRGPRIAPRARCLPRYFCEAFGVCLRILKDRASLRPCCGRFL